MLRVLGSGRRDGGVKEVVGAVGQGSGGGGVRGLFIGKVGGGEVMGNGDIERR